jgi:ATPase subunit of ABC transporter with duplicated ATPase domains
MTNPGLTLDGVTYVLPDGRTLFSNLSTTFDQRHTGLVGRNGVGKTVLARIIAGKLVPTAGRCARSGEVIYYLSQQIATVEGECVASLAGVQPWLLALQRIESGSSDERDFEALGDRWDIRQRLQAELEREGLGHLSPDTPSHTLSGGEAMRVALIGAVLSEADFLILDEPTNHLDAPHRQALTAQLGRWPKGLLVISHDRALLETMERIAELSPLGLRTYGGGYSFYADSKAIEHEAAVAQLEHHRQERKRDEDARRTQHERQQQRQARGHTWISSWPI